MKQKECLGLDTETICNDCQRKSNMVEGAEAFMLPPVSLETGRCDFYVMGEDESDKRMDVVGSNGNEGHHYKGFVNLNLLIAMLVLLVLSVLACACWCLTGSLVVGK